MESKGDTISVIQNGRKLYSLCKVSAVLQDEDMSLRSKHRAVDNDPIDRSIHSISLWSKTGDNQ
jgi:hypothetical protein